jgi:outer membrane biosynthesis protein TonB
MRNSKRLSTDGLLKMIWISLILHIIGVAFFSFTPWPKIIRMRPQAYTVTLMPISLPEPEVQKPLPPPPPPPKVIEKSPPLDKIKPIEKVKKEDIVEKVKKPPKKIEKTEEKKVDLKHLQEAMEEIRKRAALDKLQKQVARRESHEKAEERPPASPPIVPVTPTTQARAATDERIKEYYSRIWAKIKGAWTIPENLSKEVVDLEAVLVVIIERDGTIRKWWFEKKSGHSAYDQTVVRAIMKADPLPPIPRDLSEDTMEIGLRFSPD